MKNRTPSRLQMQIQSQLLSQSHIISLNKNSNSLFSHSKIPTSIYTKTQTLSLKFPISRNPIKKFNSVMTSKSNICNGVKTQLGFDFSDSELDGFAVIGNKVADAAGEVIRKYFRKNFDIVDKEDLSPVTIADQEAEASMTSILQKHFPDHAIFGEENGWRCKEKFADYVWVLDPIDGTKSFITGKPLFGTLIALLHKGKPIFGIIDQPILRERWIGITGRKTTLNGQEVTTRKCPMLSQAYLYTTSPHLFSGEAVVAFEQVRSKVKVPLYGCDCYAYALLASGFVDLVIESGLKPYDFLSLIPVIEGAGGVITDWNGHHLNWEASSTSRAPSFNVVAAGDEELHRQALDSLKLH